MMKKSEIMKMILNSMKTFNPRGENVLREKKLRLSNFKLSTLHLLLATCCLLLVTFHSYAQNVGINATGSVPDASALLDLSAANKGFLITRVDTANIPSPAFGLMTLAPADSCLYLYNGNQWMGLGGVGTNCTCAALPPPSFPCGGTVIPVVDVINPTTGKIWMDRNLGASRVATSSTDALGYGDLYQWGRCSDGHEKRTSDTVGTQSGSDTPGHGNFIINFADWRNPLNNSLWQGVAGINNPCPTGYRIPTDLELDAERLSWSTNNAAGAFASPLKLSLAGIRNGISGSLGVGTAGYYWSSTVLSTFASYLFFWSTNDFMGSSNRSFGYSVRCIKN